jgi:hypothetical protein
VASRDTLLFVVGTAVHDAEEAEHVRGVALQAWDVGAALCACEAPTRIRSGGSSSWQWWGCVHSNPSSDELLLSITTPPLQRRQHPDQPHAAAG